MCLCTGLAVETCAWKATGSSLPTSVELCLLNGSFGMVVPAVLSEDLARSPIHGQLSQSSVKSGGVERSEVKSSKMDFFLL